MFARSAATFAVRNLTKNQIILRYLSVTTCRIVPKHKTALGGAASQFQQHRLCSNSKPTEHIVDSILDHATYERVCVETLDALNDYLEQLLESVESIPGSDLAYSDGVLTINLGSTYGTYVINRQTPNRQIWLSSPTSGPKRYDFVGEASGTAGKWVYRHSGQSLHEILEEELQKIFETQKIELEDLPYGRYDVK